MSEHGRHDEGSRPHVPGECGGDAAAYALGALDPDEVEVFRRHLESCVVCRDEVAAFERVVDVLPASVPRYRSSAALRRRVLREVQGQRRPRLTGAWISRLWPTPLLAGASALAAAAVVVALVLANGGAPGARIVAAQVSGRGAAQVRLIGGHAELILHGFPVPPPGHVYEVWLQRGTAAPAPTRTLFGVARGGEARVGVSGDLRGVTRLLVTPEPAGGTLVPTHPPVIVARLD